MLKWIRRLAVWVCNYSLYKQVVAKQLKADYPHCEGGWDHCRSQCCGCVDSLEFRSRFVDARMLDLNPDLPLTNYGR